MALSKEQLKGRIRNVAKENNADARILMRIYMMERFLERVSHSKYADSFIIKGGILVTSMVGVSMRSTMDVDTTIRNLNLSEEGIVPIIKEICEIDMDDDVLFKIKEVSSIMDEMEYPGIRININAMLESMVIIIKIDISTDDVFATLNPETGIMEYQQASEIHRYKHAGKMISFKSKFLDILVTDNHRMWVRKDKAEKNTKLAWLKSFLRFDKMLIETILKIAYIFAALAITLIPFAFITSFGSFISVILFIVCGNIITRIIYELSMIRIMIWKNTTEIKNKLK